MKTCVSCKEEKKLNQFHKDKSKKDGLRNICKPCAKEKSKIWYKHSEDYRQIIRDAGLRHRFGITSSDYYDMFEEQGGVCYICKEKPDGRNLHVDHDHETGEIRGLLCKPCNHGLGNFKDSIKLLKVAIEYLDRKTVR